MKDTGDIVYGSGVVLREGLECGLDYLSIDCTVTLNIDILSSIIYFRGESRKSCILDDLVNLYLLIKGTIKLSCQGVADSSIVSDSDDT